MMPTSKLVEQQQAIPSLCNDDLFVVSPGFRHPAGESYLLDLS